MTIRLPYPYIPGDSPVADTEFQQRVQENFDALATNATPVSSGRSDLGIGTGDDVTFGRVVLPETTDPTPIANQAIVYARDNGSGKTQLCVRFGTGAVQVIATEP